MGTKAEVHRLMSMLAAQGLGILMISSELPEVLGMSDRIVVMHEGHVTACFSREEATQGRIMFAATASALNQGHTTPADANRPSCNEGARR
ncbi:ribose transport system ATP-binding protein [Candidatus Hakubella thermalkaliphila]|uniref:Ribose transport system ATP-binding protein n=1 Tax=Candidatus Hakubella thermalkaliphila TaxID=2754717 RepID=A0A6V8Q0F2_9ACTN|nr:hypothetical protein [Candidatus Hakubella thermalkaliphila]GFP36411.1 ribose transport system ATP-binding protein [Candidatus Hakubella thermalkaliphila]